MTDLFDSLSQRFEPGAPIAIRPRPQSRFETGNDAEGPVEEDAFDVVRAPETPQTPHRDTAPREQPSLNTAAPARSDAANAPTQIVTKDAASTAVPTLPNQTNVDAQHPLTDTHEIEIEKSIDPAPGPEARDKRQVPAENPPKAPSSMPEAIREIHHETTVNPAAPSPPIQTRLAPAPDRQPEPAPKPAPQEPSTVVRIGRVEMRQATPPPPPPKLPAPQRAANGAGSAGRAAGHGSSPTRGSGLTDYLGWKRK